MGTALSEARRGHVAVVGFGNLADPSTPASAFRAFSFCVTVRRVSDDEKARVRSAFQAAAGELGDAAAARSVGRDGSQATIDALEKMNALYRTIIGWPLE